MIYNLIIEPYKMGMAIAAKMFFKTGMDSLPDS